MPQDLGQEVLTFKHGRPYVQFGGPRPTNRIYYYGGDTSYFTISGVSNPLRGGITKINAHDPNQFGVYTAIGKVIDPPDFPSATFTFHEKKGALPRALVARNCLMNAYLVHGECKSLSDFDFGWDSYVEIYEHALVTDDSPGDRFMLDSDDPLMTERTVVLEAVYAAAGLQFSERNAATIAREITDVTYASRVVCGDCGPANDGAQWVYAVETGAVAAPPIVYYSTDGGSTWTASSITPASSAEAIAAIRVMGPYLVALSPTSQSATQGGYYYALINPTTGAPGSWTEVTVGFTAAREPRDMWVAGPREAYICCDGGEILRVTDVPAGAVSLGIVSASDLLRIAGNAAQDTIVAVGTAAAVVRSQNRGQSFAATVTSPGAGTVQAVEVMDKHRYWVGDNAGAVYYTLNGGETAWVSTTVAGGPATGVNDIKFMTQSTGFATYTVTGPLARVMGTINGGASWFPAAVTNPRVSGLPVTALQRYNRIAYPRVSDFNIAANYVALGGLGATTDGTLQLSAPNVF